MSVCLADSAHRLPSLVSLFNRHKILSGMRIKVNAFACKCVQFILQICCCLQNLRTRGLLHTLLLKADQIFFLFVFFVWGGGVFLSFNLDAEELCGRILEGVLFWWFCVLSFGFFSHLGIEAQMNLHLNTLYLLLCALS